MVHNEKKRGKTICVRCRWYDRQTFQSCNVGGKYHEWSVADNVTGRDYHYSTPYFEEDCRSKNKGNCKDYAYQFPWSALIILVVSLAVAWFAKSLVLGR